MSKYAAFTALQKEVGESEANAIAEFMEAQILETQKHLANREDLVREVSKIREDMGRLEGRLMEQIAKLEASFTKEVTSKYNWLVAVLTSLGVVLTLINKFL